MAFKYSNHIIEHLMETVKDTAIKNQLEMEKEKKLERVRNWEFTIPHSDLVNIQEVCQSLSRHNPVGIIKSESDSKIVIFHCYLMGKALLLDIDCPFETHITPDMNFYLTQTKMSINHIIDWAKKVKYASWGEAKEETKVMVIVPKI